MWGVGGLATVEECLWMWMWRLGCVCVCGPPLATQTNMCIKRPTHPPIPKKHTQVSNLEQAVDRLDYRLGSMEQDPRQFGMCVWGLVGWFCCVVIWGRGACGVLASHDQTNPTKSTLQHGVGGSAASGAGKGPAEAIGALLPRFAGAHLCPVH